MPVKVQIPDLVKKPSKASPFGFDPAISPAKAAPEKSSALRELYSPNLPDSKNSKERIRLQLYIAILILDLGCIILAFLFANLLRFGDLFAAPGLRCIALTSFLHAMFAFSGKAYAVEVLESPLVSVKRGLRSLALAAAAILVVFFTLKASAQLSRAVMVSGFALGVFLLSTARFLVGNAIGQRYEWNFIREILILDGAKTTPQKGQIVVYADRSSLSPSLNDPVAHDRLGRLLQNCDRVILACARSKRTIWAEALKGAGIPVEVLTPELDNLGALSFRHSAGQSCVLVAPGPMGLRDRMLKRCLDVAFALAAIILLLPVFAVIALAIKLSSPGSVFFKQPRIGLANRQFEMLKFRSMRHDVLDTNGATSTTKIDDRITPLGRFLRRTSLDELPQFFNVLKGDMSLVGPRPHALASKAEEKLFWDIDNRYWHRGSVKPGMTGLAQIRGFRGATHCTEDLTNRLHSDLEYLTDWNIWKDLLIIIKTGFVLIHPNAY